MGPHSCGFTYTICWKLDCWPIDPVVTDQRCLSPIDIDVTYSFFASLMVEK
jgi:hypothetical protein